MDTYARYQKMIRKYPSTVIGKSVFGRAIHAFFVGNPALRPVIIQSAMHAREWITAEVCMQAFQTAKSMRVKGAYWFVPITNPDGVLLATRGVSTLPTVMRHRLIQINGGKDFSLWKANGRGVDLNVNFPARFGEGAKNVFFPAPENYVGTAPESEPCTKALMRFTRFCQPLVTVSLHTKGQEIYWQFPLGKGAFSGNKKLGERLFAPLGYPFIKAGQSTGGYKDWCISALQIPAYTLELFSDELSHPIKRDALRGISPVLSAILQNTEKEVWKNVKNSCALP